MLLADGTLRLDGQAVSLPDAVAQLAEDAQVRLLPDRAAPAAQLVQTAQALRMGGVGKLVLVTQEGVK